MAMQQYNLRQDFQRRLDALKADCLAALRVEVARVCDKNKWDFRTGPTLHCCPRGTPEKNSYKAAVGEDDNKEAGLLADLVYWYEETFQEFPEGNYVDGAWDRPTPESVSVTDDYEADMAEDDDDD